MITEKELEISNESYLHKDFYQVYNELLDLAKKISKRWDPSSSNESDAGVVLLKLLAFVADKNNYNIDKEILERFMPSATQESSMRERCETLGYNMSYYRSATTNVSFMYQGNELENNSITLKAFETTLTNEAGDVNFVLTEDAVLDTKFIAKTKPAIEGTLCQVKIGDDNVIRLNDIDSSNKYYLPEYMIAENGVWIRNASGTTTNTNDWNQWNKVDNLNIQVTGTKCFKFSFDSKKQLPYIEFPQYISSIIENGLEIQYVRTKGAAGNISANTLTKISNATTIKSNNNSDLNIKLVDESTGDVYLVVKNLSSTVNGADKESIDDAYNNFKKTIGTFDTLVTCRDYANKIYNMLEDSNPLVSNIQVSDIRTDINKSASIMTYNNLGTVFEDVVIDENNTITNFDIIFYPFKPILNSYTKDSYKNSFTRDFTNMSEITSGLDDYKTISHNIKTLKENSEDLYCIKNYYKLNAKITTTYKVNIKEETDILKNIKEAIYKKFNMRNIDFGEEIPYETIFNTIKNADVRIKNVSLEEPTLETKYMLANKSEDYLTNNKEIYIKYLAKNILAGKTQLFDYKEDIEYDFNQSKINNYDVEYKNIKKIESNFNFPELATDNDSYTLKDNEVIQFRAPNLTTINTYTLVNYLWESDSTVASNEEYLLKGTDTLYISYTDPDNKLHKIVYKAKSIITDDIKTETVDHNIIKVDFEMTSGIKDTNYKKVVSFNNIDKNLNILSSNEQIEIRDIIEVTLDKTLNCYWVTSDGKINFNDNNEYMLKTGEYFFYTDDSYNSLAILGSGTLLKISNKNAFSFNINYENSKIDLDSVANNGIGAFSLNDWRVMNFTATNNLKIQEQQIVTLIKDNVISGIVNAIDSNWRAVDSSENINYSIDGSNNQTLPKLNLGDNITWKVRTRLDFNLGPNLIQTLNANDSITITYNSNLKKIISNASLKCSYLLQYAGNEVNLVGEDGILSVFNINNATMETRTNPVNILNIDFLDFTNISFEKNNNVKLNIIVPADSFGIMMVYSASNNVKVEADSGAIITLFKDGTSLNEGTLATGINVIKIANSCTLTLSTQTAEGAIVFDKLRLVSTSTNENGVDLESLNIEASDAANLLDKLNSFSNGKFYYNAVLDKTKLIDNDNMSDVYVWYDYNNVYNKFVISEIDADYLDKGIQLAKSSKL